MPDSFTPEELAIFDPDNLGCDTSDVVSRGVMGCEVFAADGESIQERTLPRGKWIMIPHPFMTDRLINMVVQKRSKDGESYAQGYGYTAVLVHDDEQGWHCTGMLSNEAFEEVREVVNV